MAEGDFRFHCKLCWQIEGPKSGRGKFIGMKYHLESMPKVLTTSDAKNHHQKNHAAKAIEKKMNKRKNTIPIEIDDDFRSDARKQKKFDVEQNNLIIQTNNKKYYFENKLSLKTSSLSSNGHVHLAKPDEQLEQIMDKFLAEVKKTHYEIDPISGELKNAQRINGNTHQTESKILSECAFYQQFVDKIGSISKFQVKQAKIRALTDEMVDEMTIQTVKMLTSKKGTPGQALHRDCPVGNYFVVAYYITPNSLSTMFSKEYDWAANLANTNYLGECAKREQNKRENSPLEKACRAQILEYIMDGFSRNENDLIYSTIKKRGEIGIFQANKIHCGPPNNLDENREVLFCVLGSAIYPFSDEFQQFEWNLAESAFGLGSTRHMQALLKWKDKNPEMHEPTWDRALRDLLFMYNDCTDSELAKKMNNIFKEKGGKLPPWAEEKKILPKINSMRMP